MSSGWIDSYRAYLGTVRAAVDDERVVHAAQRVALDRELAIAARATDATSHARLGGAPFELTRAAWIDRVVGHARIAATLDDPWGVRACSIELAGALVGDTAEAMRDALVEVGPRAHAVRGEGTEAITAFARLAICLVRLQGERRSTELGELRRDVAACGERVAAQDRADFARPRHRWRVPWAEPALLARWLAASAPGATTGPIADEPAPLLAEVTRMAERWQRSLADDRRSRTLDAAPPTFVAADVANGLETCRAGIRDLVATWRARQRTWPEPLVAEHARALEEACEVAPTPTSIDLVSMHAAGCLAIEAVWWQALLACVGGPLRSALVASYDPTAATEASIAAARDAATVLVGEPDPWRVAWFEELVARNLIPHAIGELEHLGAMQGEAGFELLYPWRTWTAIRIASGHDISLERARSLTQTDLPSVAERRRVCLWGREVGLDALDRSRAVLGRPPVPGFTPGRFAPTGA